MATSIDQTHQYSCLENPLTEKPGRPQPTGLQRVGHDQSDPTHIDTRLFWLWKLCPHESWAWWWWSCLACRYPGSTKCARTQTASATGVMTLPESFFRASLVAGDQKASLASLSLVALPIQALRGLPCLGSFSVVPWVRNIQGTPGWGSTR